MANVWLYLFGYMFMYVCVCEFVCLNWFRRICLYISVCVSLCKEHLDILNDGKISPLIFIIKNTISEHNNSSGSSSNSSSSSSSSNNNNNTWKYIAINEILRYIMYCDWVFLLYYQCSDYEASESAHLRPR